MNWRIQLLLDSPITMTFLITIGVGVIFLGIAELIAWFETRRWKRLIDSRPYLHDE
jgi:hypothetical protein